MANLLFTARQAGAGWQIWTTDGTAAGTRAMTSFANTVDGTFLGFSEAQTHLGRFVLFGADLEGHGRELWATSLSGSDQPILVLDIVPGPGGSSPSLFHKLYGNMVFLADTPLGGQELWLTDGISAANTRLLLDINPGTGSSRTTQFAVLPDGRLVFDADNGSQGRELWVTDGTTVNTRLLRDINPGGASSDPTGFTALSDGRLVFAARTADRGTELWVTDGSAAGTSMVKDLGFLADSGAPYGFTGLPDGRVAFFAASNQPSGGRAFPGLWVTDGSADGTVMLVSLPPLGGGAGLTLLASGNALLRVDDGSSTLLWTTDFTPSGTGPLLNAASFPAGLAFPAHFTPVAGNRMVFTANASAAGLELWSSDGTAGGTQRIASIPTTSAYGGTIELTSLLDGRAVFRNSTVGTGVELWVTDGTVAGTSLLRDIDPGAGSGLPAYFTLRSGEPAASFTLTGSGPTLKEGGNSGASFAFTVTRSGDLAHEASVEWTVLGASSFPDRGYTASGEDFLAGMLPRGTVVFAPYQTSRTINIQVAGDQILEGSETFGVQLTTASGGTPGTGILGATILDDDSVITLTGPGTSVTEGLSGARVLTFTATRTGDLTSRAEASWSVAGSGANPAQASDFSGGTLPGGTLTFAAGETQKSFVIRVAGDALAEEDEEFTLSLGNTVNATIQGAPQTITIVTDDSALRIAPPTSTAEGQIGSTPFNFVVTRSGDLSQADQAMWTVARNGGRSADAADFVGGVLPSGIVTFAPGQRTATITVLVAADRLVEPDESFSVTLSNSFHAALAQPIAVATIGADDKGVTLVGHAAVIEGNAGSTLLPYEVVRSGDMRGDITLTWEVVGIGENPGTASDFVGNLLPSGTITFGSDASRFFGVNIVADTLPEPNENFVLRLRAEGDVILLNNEFATTIVTDDTGVSISGPAAGFVVEGSGSPTLVTFTVTRSGNLDAPASVAWAVVGSGANAADFADGVLPSGRVSFAPGETSQSITIRVLADRVVEPDEEFSIQLSAPVNTQIGQGGASLTIRTDDTQIDLSGPTAGLPEGNSGATDFVFTVTRTGDLSRSVTNSWQVVGTGATTVNGRDFVGGSLPYGEVTFAPGESLRSITIQVAGDSVAEMAERFALVLFPSAHGPVGNGRVETTILPDETAFTLTGPAAPIREGDAGFSVFNFTVARVGDLSEAFTGILSVAGSGPNPADGLDFVEGARDRLPATTITLAPGETSRVVAIQVRGDQLPEADEGFTLTLTNPAGSVLATASAVIASDDTTLSVLPNEVGQPGLITLLERDAGLRMAEVTILRAGVTTGTSSATWSLVPEGASPVSAADFAGGALPTGTVTFAPGETRKSVTLALAPDAIIEPGETFTFRLSNLVGAVVDPSAPLAGRLGVVLDDDGVISVSDASLPVTEGDSGTTPVRFVVTRTGLGTSEAVSWAITGSGANPASAQDFAAGVLPSGVIEFGTETSRTITVLLAGDRVMEADEGFTLTLFNPVQAKLGTASAAATIRNDEWALALAGPAAPIAEGDAGRTPFTFTVTRSGDLSGVATAQWQVTGGGANGADFLGGALPSGSVTFAAGETSKTITLDVAGDLLAEPDEGFALGLSYVAGGVATNLSAGAVIRADDTELTLAGPGGPVAEGNVGGTPVTFTVTRRGDLTGSSSVDWSVTGTSGNPINGQDLLGGRLPSGTLAFAPGEAVGTITLSIQGDDAVEANEVLLLTLANPTGARLGQASATAVLRNDDAALSVTGPAMAVTEGQGGSTPVTFTVTRFGDLSGSASARWAVAGSGANPADSSDFAGGVLPEGLISFAPGEASRTITILAAGDTALEADEGFTLALISPSGAVLGTATAQAVLRNDDAQLAVSAPAAPILEGSGGTTPVTFTVTRSGDLSGSASARWAVTGSGASPADAADFAGGVLPEGVVSFAAGEASRSITLELAADSGHEPGEGFTLTLSQPQGASLLPGAASAEITDDDAGLFISAPVSRVIEGHSGWTFLSYVVTRTGPTTGTSSADWSVAGFGPAPTDAEDFLPGSPLAGRVTFAPGETQQTIIVELRGEDAYEADEALAVTLSNPLGASLAQPSVVTTIVNDDAGLAIAGDVSVQQEGQSGTTLFTFTVTRIGDASRLGLATWTVTGMGDNPAEAEDFLGGAFPQGPVVFQPGETLQTITIAVAADRFVEGDEAFQVTLSHPFQLGFSQKVAGGIIREDDGPATRVVFRASEAPIGTTELWITDGTEAGTSLLRDPDPFGSSFPDEFARLGDGRVVFSAGLTSQGRELWVTDGSFGGTMRVAVLRQGPDASYDGSDPRYITRLGDGRAVFSADDGLTGRELWVTDGTAGGTSRVVDLNPGPDSSDPYGFTALPDGRLIFDTEGLGIWVTDGTEAGTTVLNNERLDPWVGTAQLSGGRSLFGSIVGSYTTPWVTDGTYGGTSPLTARDPASGAEIALDRVSGIGTLANGQVVFSARGESLGAELWTTDGSAAGTRLIADIRQGSRSSDAERFTLARNGALVFSADDGLHGDELWVTDGTAAGTSLLADIAPGEDGGRPSDFTPLGDGRLVFSAENSSAGRELWVTDGTAAGTSLLADLYPAGSGVGGHPEGFKALADGRVLFSAQTGSGKELWITDGTASGTILLRDIHPGAGNSYPGGFTALGTAISVSGPASVTEGHSGGTTVTFTVIRTGLTAEVASAAWSVAGSGANPADAADFAGGVLPSGLVSFRAGETIRTITLQLAGDALHEANEGFTLTLADPVRASLLRSTVSVSILNDDAGLAIAAPAARVVEGQSGATSVTFTVTRLGDATGSASADWAVTGSGTAAAQASDFAGGVLPSGTVLFAPGETSRSITLQLAGDALAEADEGFTVTLSNPSGASLITASASSLIGNDDTALRFVFLGFEPGTGAELWVTDGTAPGTSLVQDTGAATPGYGLGPQHLAGLLDGRVVFGGLTDGTDRELWVTDGTAAGTSLLVEINPGAGSDPAGFTRLADGRLAFAADDGTRGGELWVTDGTQAGTSLLADINPGAGASSPAGFTALGNGRLVFLAQDGSTGAELWSTDGTAAGTQRVADLRPGAAGSQPLELTLLADGRAVFSATSTRQDRELWVTDGTTAGTSLVKDILPGILGSEPTGFTALGDGRLVFSAEALRQLWVTDGSAAGTSMLADLPVLRSNYQAGGIFAALGGRLLFRAEDSTGDIELWVTDGSAAGTSRLADINPGGSAFGTTYSNGFGRLADGRVMFGADDGTHGTELWVTDGTAAGTSLVADIRPTANGVAYGSDPRDFTALPDGRLLFGANDGTGAAGGSIWVTDGTEGGTVRLAEVLPGLGTSYPAGFSPLNTTSISAAPARVAEALSGSTDVTFTLTRSGDVGGSALIRWAVAGQGANPASGADFLGGALPGGLVSFAAGEASRSVTLQIAGDMLSELEEGFVLRLSDAIGTHLGLASAGVVIENAVVPNRPPVVTSARAVTFAENGSGIAYQASATDPDSGSTLTWLLSGADAALFTLDAAGAIRFKATPDFEAPGDLGGDNVHDLVVTVADGLSGVGFAITITVTPVNEAPIITSGAGASFAENGGGIAYQGSATDPEGSSPLIWSLEGADAALFTVDATGAIRFLAPPDFEAPRDARHAVTLIASDGALRGEKALLITVTDANEAPVITSAATARFAENGTGIVHQAEARDADAGASLNWSLAGEDAGLFTVDATGALRFAAAPNFEAPRDAGGDNGHEVILIASDGAISASQALRITVTDVNEAPRITSGAAGSFAENGTGIAYQAMATDPDAGASLTWSLAGADAALFTLDATGALRFRDAPDFEAPRDADGDNAYAVTLIASDGGLADRQAISIRVTDAPEAPAITSPVTASFTENGSGIAYQAMARDPDAEARLTWSLEGEDAGLFTLDATGALSFVTAPDFEAPGDAGADNGHALILVVSDGTQTVRQALTLTVTDANEAPLITSGATASVSENEAGIIHQATASDPDAGARLIWSLAGADAARFTLDAAGALRFRETPDFEAPQDAGGDNGYDVTLIASDGGLTAQRFLTITVTDVNEAPRITTNGTASFSENGTGIVLQAGAEDPDAGTTLTWSLAGADAALFTVDATGAIRFRAAPDHERPRDAGADNIHELLLRVSDGSRVTEQAVSITVLDVAEVTNATGGAGDELLTGGPLGDLLRGRGGSDTLLGLAGDDRLDGGAGADRMEGGAGNDRYTVDEAGDLVMELADGGLDLVTASITYVLPEAVEQLVLSGLAPLSGTGNALDNRITGNAAGNLLAGEGGSDSLYGGLGEDRLIGGDGQDSLDGGGGADEMQGGAGDDRYIVDHLGDVALELAGGGLDLVLASVSFTLGAELEQLTLTGTAHLSGTGNALANRITGNAGDNLLLGDAGNDTLLGGAGADTLIGGLGQDRLQGQAGADVFRFLAIAESAAGGATRDILVDFSAAAGDALDLTALDANSLLAGDQAFTWLGAGAFTATAGQLRYAGGVLAGDVSGDGLADFELVLSGAPALGVAQIWL